MTLRSYISLLPIGHKTCWRNEQYTTELVKLVYAIFEQSQFNTDYKV